MRAAGRALVFSALATALVAPTVHGDDARGEGEKALWSRLESRLRQVGDRLDGVLGLSLQDLETGARVDIRSDQPFPLASTIKLGVLYELYRQADAGRLDLGETTRPAGGMRAGGDGVLQELGDAVSLTWRDLAVLMMGWSDNAATNILIGRVGMEAVNRRLEQELDLEGTRLRRLMMDGEAARAGRENVGTPSEMRQLVEAVYAGRGLSPALARDLRKVAALPKDSAFRRPLPAEGLAILDKPGELEGVRCATAVVDLPGRPYSISINTAFLHHDEDGTAAIGEISKMVYEAFDRLSRSSPYGRRMR